MNKRSMSKTPCFVYCTCEQKQYMIGLGCVFYNAQSICFDLVKTGDKYVLAIWDRRLWW